MIVVELTENEAKLLYAMITQPPWTAAKTVAAMQDKFKKGLEDRGVQLPPSEGNA